MMLKSSQGFNYRLVYPNSGLCAPGWKALSLICTKLPQGVKENLIQPYKSEMILFTHFLICCNSPFILQQFNKHQLCVTANILHSS